jgi:hypothetical protein
MRSSALPCSLVAVVGQNNPANPPGAGFWLRHTTWYVRASRACVSAHFYRNSWNGRDTSGSESRFLGPSPALDRTSCTPTTPQRGEQR